MYEVNYGPEELTPISNANISPTSAKRAFCIDPAINNEDFTNLVPTLPVLVKQELDRAIKVSEGGARLNFDRDAFVAVIVSKGISYTHADTQVFYKLGADSEIEYYRIVDIIRAELRTLRLEVVAINYSEFYIWGQMGIVASFTIHRGLTSHSVAMVGAQAVVIRLHRVIIENAVTIHPPAVNSIILDDREILNFNLKKIPELAPDIPWKAFYPYFDFTPAELWEDFSASRANIVFVYGLPGLGKSNFIRAMMDARGYNKIPYLADDENVLSHRTFNSFLAKQEYGTLLVSEDSDNLVRKREDGNSQMTGILNLGQGIASGGLKMIISTNLKSLNQVDEALYRPGRTFRSLEFKTLNPDQANVAREGIKLKSVVFNKEKITLAEALNWEAYLESAQNSGVGFVK